VILCGAMLCGFESSFIATLLKPQTRREQMAYQYTNSKGRTYFLHSRDTTLKNGKKQTIYFFAKEEKDGALNDVPKGYEVSESKNGLPVLKRQ
jgi:hypothetical protein